MPAFDTLKATKLLKESGFEETQAEAVVATVRDAVAENVATKADLAEVCNELKIDHAKLRTELKEEITNVRTDMYRFGAFMIIAIVSLIVTLMKILP